MATPHQNVITVETTVHAPIEKVWELWTVPEHIQQWNNASEDWHTPSATNDLRAGGTFNYSMAAKDGSFAFDFVGVYDEVEDQKKISYTAGDGRKVEVLFSSVGNATQVTESFEAEGVNPMEMQKSGWQAILDNFKKYVESN